MLQSKESKNKEQKIKEKIIKDIDIEIEYHRMKIRKLRAEKESVEKAFLFS